MCELYRRKPEVTFDNFTADYGRALVEGYKEKWKEASTMKTLKRTLDGTVQFE